MRRNLLLAAAVALLATFGTFAANATKAAPAGAATGLSIFDQSCDADGTVRATLNWLPSGRGQQWVDLAAVDDNFTSRYSRGGPFAESLNRVTLTQMGNGTTYYARIITQDGADSTYLISDTLTFTAGCPGPSDSGGEGISPPTRLVGTALSGSSLRFEWEPGAGNAWFCLNVATSAEDLENGGPSWRNYGCWLTGSSLVVEGLTCSTVYYWNVYTWNNTASTTSARDTSRTADCSQGGFSAPSDLHEVAIRPTSVLLTWEPGLNNWWYCVYMATNISDLVNGGATQANYGCWSTNPGLVVSRLLCNTVYYWNVHAWNPTDSAVSVLSVFRTAPCEPTLEEAPIDDLRTLKVSDFYLVQIVAGLPSGCHSSGPFEVERSGNLINITVLNRVTDSGACTLVYGTYDLTINIGRNFVPGQVYFVDVNEERVFFIAD